MSQGPERRTLESVLEIFTNWLTPEERRGLFLAEQKYKERGSPVTKEQLDRVLEEILDECRRLHVRYPKAILKRKAQMQRGEFTPAPQAEPISPAPRVCCLDCRAEYDGAANPNFWLRKHNCFKRPRTAAAQTQEKKAKEAS